MTHDEPGGAAPAHPGLTRALGLGDAVVIGLGSMIGAGVFAAFAPAAGAAGAGLLVGLLVAAVVAYCNATATAQLAAQYPTSGGVYVYGRARLGDWWGFLAGWGFVVGKTGSCAAMALTFAAYAAPPGWQRPVAVAAVLALAGVNYRGVTRTARLTRIIVMLVLAALVVTVVASLAGGGPDPGRLRPAAGDGYDVHGVLQSAGLLFFAFAGYARIATLGEEVRDPARTIPRAVQLALAGAVAVYAVVAVTVLAVLGPDRVASVGDPLAEAVRAGSWDWAVPVVQVGGALAALGALLALIAGVGRTGLAMAREGDLPRWLAAVHPRHRVPHHAEVALAVVVSALVLTVDLRDAIGFSSFGVLLYYLVANLAAWTQDREHRRFSRALQGVGAVGSAVLVVTLPSGSVVAGLVVLAVGVGYRAARRHVRRPASARGGADGEPSAAGRAAGWPPSRATSCRHTGPVEIERIGPDQWQRFREVRLESLRDSPAAFGSRYDDWSEADEERWRARLVAVPLTLLARDGDRVVGVACGSPQGEDAVELLSMWVAPDSRGTGVADALVAAVVEWAADQGRTTHLMVRSDNARARTAYERAGFVDAGVPEGWPTDQPQERRMERRDGDRAGRRP